MTAHPDLYDTQNSRSARLKDGERLASARAHKKANANRAPGAPTPLVSGVVADPLGTAFHATMGKNDFTEACRCSKVGASWSKVLIMAVLTLLPNRGTLTARMFENQANGISNGLIYDIAIPVCLVLDLPPDLAASFQHDTTVRLDFIRIGLIDWRELAGRKFTFPVNPEHGYVDGSIYFDSAHQYADLTRLHFGVLVGSTMMAAVTITFNFYPNSALPGLPETITVDWNIAMDVDTVELDRVLAEARAVLGGA
jgi:hypothetical protein